MKILLTGANGFIGRNILESLSSRHNIIAVSHKEIDLKSCDAVEEFMRGQNFDAVIHSAAAPTHRAAKNIEEAPMTNLLMYTALAKAAVRCGVKKFITYGSGSEYGQNRNLCDVTEEQLGQVIPSDVTGFPKYLMNYIRESGLKMHNLRCFGVFGKYEDYSIRFISNAICRALSDYSISLKQDRVFSYLYIDDLAEITEFFLEGDFRFYDYNITPNEKWSLLDLARLVRRITMKDVPINVANPNMGYEYSGSNKRLHKELNYTYTPMIEAVKMLVDWYILNYDMIDKEKILYCK
jgi:GDP-L-fucose synthase